MKSINTEISRWIDDVIIPQYDAFGRNLPNHQLQTSATACGFDLRRHHNALADAEACAAIAMKTMSLADLW